VVFVAAPVHGDATVRNEVLQQAQTQLGDTLEAVVGDRTGGCLDWRVETGDPRQVLVDLSDDVDLVVVGSRGHGQVAGLLLGSVGQHVVTHAHCPVTVVRDART
jgi:nucleotide-binding universal stress UspA family protein